MTSKGRRATVGVAVVVLAILHQDFWAWDSRAVWFGFLPEGLGYHVLYSVACGLFWWVVVTRAWPEHLERWAEGDGVSGADR